MCITSETCRANSVIKTALNNLHQAGPNKPIYDDAWKHKNQIHETNTVSSVMYEKQVKKQLKTRQNFECEFLYRCEGIFFFFVRPLVILFQGEREFNKSIFFL